MCESKKKVTEWVFIVGVKVNSYKVVEFTNEITRCYAFKKDMV